MLVSADSAKVTLDVNDAATPAFAPIARRSTAKRAGAEAGDTECRTTARLSIPPHPH